MTPQECNNCLYRPADPKEQKEANKVTQSVYNMPEEPQNVEECSQCFYLSKEEKESEK